MREMFKRHPELVEKLSPRSKLAADLVPIHGFELQEGSIVFIRGATERQIRGTPADIVVIDEACQIKNSIILSTIGRLTGKIAKFIILSTPDIATSIFVKWATEKNSGFKVFTWEATIKECPWHNKDQEKLKKKEYTKEQYAALVLGRPPTKAERAFFTRKHIEKCIYTVDPLREGGEKSRIEVGLDFGLVESWTILTVTERIGTTKRKILAIKRWKLPPKALAVEILKYLVTIKKDFGQNAYVIKADSKPPEYKQALKERTNKIRFLDATFHKEHMLGQLQRMIRAHCLIIPTKFVPLLKQLYKYRKGMKKGDDYVDSLAYSIYEPAAGFTKESHGRIYFPGDT